MKRSGCRRLSGIILALIMSVISLAGCTVPDDKQKNESQTDEKRLQIGMSFDSFVIERWQRDRDVFVATARDLGADVNVQSANGEIEEQI